MNKGDQFHTPPPKRRGDARQVKVTGEMGTPDGKINVIHIVAAETPGYPGVFEIAFVDRHDHVVGPVYLSRQTINRALDALGVTE